MLPQLVLVAMVLVAGTLDRTGRIGAVALLAISVEWLRVNQPFEGRVLLVLLPTHGLTAADLVGLAAIGLAIWRWFDAGRTRGRTREH